MLLPGVIIFMNDSITTAVLNTFVGDIGIQPDNLIPNPNSSTVQIVAQQLQITEVISFTEFNTRVSVMPTYPTTVRLSGYRVLVILPDFQDTTNRNLADVVMFVKQGLASIEKCMFGPPGFTLDVQRLNIFNLLYGIKASRNTVCVPCFNEVPQLPPTSCPAPFPPPICPPQTQTAENPRPHEHLSPRREAGLGALELFGVETLEKSQGPGHSVFGPKLDERGGDNDGGEFGGGDTEGEV